MCFGIFFGICLLLLLWKRLAVQLIFLMFNIYCWFLFFLCVHSMANAINKLRAENPFNFHRCSLCIVLIGSFWKCWPWVRVSQRWFAGPPSRHSTWPQNITWMYRCFRAASITHFYASPTLLHCVLEKVIAHSFLLEENSSMFPSLSTVWLLWIIDFHMRPYKYCKKKVILDTHTAYKICHHIPQNTNVKL